MRHLKAATWKQYVQWRFTPLVFTVWVKFGYQPSKWGQRSASSYCFHSGYIHKVVESLQDTNVPLWQSHTQTLVIPFAAPEGWKERREWKERRPGRGWKERHKGQLYSIWLTFASDLWQTEHAVITQKQPQGEEGGGEKEVLVCVCLCNNFPLRAEK